MLKLLTEEDIPAVVELGRHFLDASPYSNLEFSEAAARRSLQLCLLQPEKNICILSENEEGVIVGALLGAVTSLPFSDDLVAAEIAWWVEPSHRKGSAGLRMKEAYEYWARKMGAKKISMALLSGPYEDKLDKYYRSSGFQKAETAYVRDT